MPPIKNTRHEKRRASAKLSGKLVLLVG